MKENYIVLDVARLVSSNSNVRDGHSKENIESMGLSLSAHGIINAPCVAISTAGEDGVQNYEIIAGNLRVLGAQKAGFQVIQCKDVSDLDEAQRIELSLSENVDRVRMTDLQTFYAFARLFKAGRSIEQIASIFNKTPNQVNRMMAIGNLPKKLLMLAEETKMQGRALHALAIAGKDNVSRYMKLKPKDRPRDWEVYDWLKGNDGWYKASVAIFPIEEYKGHTTIDMFADEESGEVLCLDGSIFMELQREAANKKIAEYEKNGWTCTEIDYWQDWMYQRVAKSKGGQVFYSWGKDGSFDIHVGYKRPEKAGKAPAPTGKNSPEKKQPEISAEFATYMQHLRHNGVRAEFLDHDNAGIVAAIMLIVNGTEGNWHIREQDLNGIKNDAYRDSIIKSVDYSSMLEEYKKIPLKISELMKLDIATLVNHLSVAVAWRWQIVQSEDMTKAFAKAMGLKEVYNWVPDEAFWLGIKSKATLIKIAKEHGISVDAKGTAATMRKKLMTNVKPNGWRPKWLKF